MQELLALRLAGATLGFLGLVALLWLRFRARRLRNLECLMGGALCVALVVVARWPDTANGVLAFFSFEAGGGGRLLGLLVFSNLLLFLLAFWALARAGRVEHLADRLVRELAKREFRGSPDASRPAVAPIYVVIPAYNEADNIASVLREIPGEVAGLRTRTLVVVDGGTDETARVVTELNHSAIRYVVNRGGGSALRAGYEVAIEDGADIVVTLDADGQHVPEEMARLVEPIVAGEADLVNGSRVLGRYEKDGLVRPLGVVFFNLLISLLTLRRITDCSNAFRAIRVRELGKLDLRQPQFHTAELLLEALKKGLRVREVPITIKRRLSGESKKPTSFRYGWRFSRALLSTWLR
jgi:hypothetical protein